MQAARWDPQPISGIGGHCPVVLPVRGPRVEADSEVSTRTGASSKLPGPLYAGDGFANQTAGLRPRSR